MTVACTRAKCSIDGCDNDAFARGLCCSHYGRERRAGRIESYRRTNIVCHGRCSIDGCDGPNFGRGLCRSHNRRAVNVGDLPGAPTCSAMTRTGVSCTRSATAGGMCGYHRSRVGVPRAARSYERRSHDRRRINCNGYVLLWRPGHPEAFAAGEAFEHKVVASDFIGRKLEKHENVHHRNGDKTDNTVGPCLTSTECRCSNRHNLELWSTSQPSGQRVADKLRWAMEIVDLYGSRHLVEEWRSQDVAVVGQELRRDFCRAHHEMAMKEGDAETHG